MAAQSRSQVTPAQNNVPASNAALSTPNAFGLGYGLLQHDSVEEFLLHFFTVLRLFPPRALISRAQGSSGVVENMPFAWRGHTKEPHHSGQAEP